MANHKQIHARIRDQAIYAHYTMPGHLGAFLACRPTAPPPVAQYDEWLTGLRKSADARSRTPLTGAKLRRAVLMVRGGETKKDIGRAIGVDSHSVANWLNKLPPELAP